MVAYYLCAYEKGKREKNEDSLAVHKIHTRAGEVVMAVICDGCGGHEEGETASGHAVEVLSSWFYDVLPGLIKDGKSKNLQHGLQNVLFGIHSDLKKYGERKKIKLGTTVSGIIIRDTKYTVFWLGDTHVYRTGRRLKRLTVPHIAGGGINRCLGMGSFKRADCISGRAGDGGFLITSDGLGGTLTAADLHSVTGSRGGEERESVRKGLDTLVKTALARGEGDNMSAIYLKVQRR
ncbi:MAG: protein phosphatase 2C domain-containing protein [Lachnospiraceae bacterium]|nr:protein phosphatase 2C domain-containing protein [Lachnospiraceae bacterium]